MLYYWERFLLMSKKPNIFFLIQLANRYAIAQDFIMHDALLRGKSSLDQLALGLDAVKVLHLIRLFPEELRIFSHTIPRPFLLLSTSWSFWNFQFKWMRKREGLLICFESLLAHVLIKVGFALITETLCGVIGPIVSIAELASRHLPLLLRRLKLVASY